LTLTSLSMTSSQRDIAIIAHVDHAKTTLIVGMLKQSGTVESRPVVAHHLTPTIWSASVAQKPCRRRR